VAPCADGARHGGGRGQDLFGLLPSADAAAVAPTADADATADAQARFGLPADVFASPFEEDVGLLNLAAPSMDDPDELAPDVAQVLEALEDEAFLGELEEDFVLQLADDDDEDDVDADEDGWYDDDEDDDEEEEEEEARPAASVRKATAPAPARSRDEEGEEEEEEEEEEEGEEEGEAARPTRRVDAKRPAALQDLDDRFERARCGPSV
jgi:hypothetical protein